MFLLRGSHAEGPALNPAQPLIEIVESRFDSRYPVSEPFFDPVEPIPNPGFDSVETVVNASDEVYHHAGQ